MFAFTFRVSARRRAGSATGTVARDSAGTASSSHPAARRLATGAGGRARANLSIGQLEGEDRTCCTGPSVFPDAGRPNRGGKRGNGANPHVRRARKPLAHMGRNRGGAGRVPQSEPCRTMAGRLDNRVVLARPQALRIRCGWQLRPGLRPAERRGSRLAPCSSNRRARRRHHSVHQRSGRRGHCSGRDLGRRRGARRLAGDASRNGGHRHHERARLAGTQGNCLQPGVGDGPVGRPGRRQPHHALRDPGVSGGRYARPHCAA